MALIGSRMLAIRLQRNAKSISCIVLMAFFGSLVYFTMCAMPCDHARNVNRHITEDSEFSHTQSAFMVVLILTGPRYFERRDTIRETWLSNQPKNLIKTYFAIGTAGLEKEELSTLLYENSKHNDLLMLPTLQDSYYNLTQKVVESFMWVNKHIDYKFLLKADDDTFVRMDVILNELREKHPKRLYWGFFDGRARVKTKGQWAETKFKLCDHYLPHARGGGYILSSDLVNFIATNSKYLQKFNSEDISVGTWLAPLDINRIHDPRFDTEYVSRGCLNAYIVTHKQNVQQMKMLHENLQNNGKLCPKEYKSKNSYIYNWNVPPSLCCLRNDSTVP